MEREAILRISGLNSEDHAHIIHNLLDSQTGVIQVKVSL